MSTLTATAIAASPKFSQVRSTSCFRGENHHTGYNLQRICLEFHSSDGRRGSRMTAQSGPLGLWIQSPLDRRRHMHSTRTASVICASALNARCGAEQTQTVTREAPTITHIPGKEKSPQLDDGDSGFPPRDDGDGGGGGGGGGGNWSGGFFFFGFLAFLGFLKDKESEGPYRDDRRR
ncbi:Embryo defective protein [Quillaja saponaria]|uniref:Embryo defective protein n=1 Tax=Quillaja saponaria TaxID=32244 RepID=A0AAD7LT19_QUISA|nr:Embryo defective protein [Quillaja saponaria]